MNRLRFAKNSRTSRHLRILRRYRYGEISLPRYCPAPCPCSLPVVKGVVNTCNPGYETRLLSKQAEFNEHIKHHPSL